MTARLNAAPTHALLVEFDRLHRLHIGYPAVIRAGKDAKLLAGLWRSHGEALVLALMEDLFTSRDPFIQQNGYTVGMLLSQAGKLLARRAASHRPRYEESWYAECAELHDSTCTGITGHTARMKGKAT